MRGWIPAVVLLAACVSSGDAAAPAGAPPANGPTPPGPSSPTWYRDIEPIVQRDCVRCHIKNGTGGFLLDRETTVLLAKFIADRVSTRYMPPWPPGPGSAPLVDMRSLDSDEIGAVVGWAQAGAPLGDPRDHVERPARVPRLPARSADLELGIDPALPYHASSNVLVNDEVRCFVLDLPAALADGAWITATQWRAGMPIGIHSLAGVPLDASAAATAHAREARDGRAGFECGGGLGSLAHGPPLGANGTGAAVDGSMLPDGTAVRVPTGGAVLMRIHYAVKHLGEASDASRVKLWLAGDAERKALHALELQTITAPAEVPCPTGPSPDPESPCNRDNAFARLAQGAAADARSQADALLASCGTTLDASMAKLAFGPSVPDHFLVPTSCTKDATFNGTIRVVHARMQTRGASVRVEAEQTDGAWASVLDIPAWRWAWDGAYVLEDGVAIWAGRKVRVTCTFDNGTLTQWSARTGEPGHDAPSLPPVLAPQYVIAAENRAAETCTAFLGIERATP